MADNLNDPNRSNAAHETHGARKVDIGPERKSSLAWLWLLLIPLIALLAWALWPKQPAEQAAPVEQTNTAADTAALPVSNAVDVTTATPATPAPAPAIPSGSGVVSNTQDGHPALIVYFETGKSEVSKDLSSASASVKSYLDAHAGSTVSVSGFNDPTGDATANAALSKHRAEGVSKALTDAGIAPGAIKLDKPADATGTGDTNAQSRRVEVTVHG